MLCGPIYVPRTLLTLTFPAQMDTLSIDAGFDQSPVLQSIRDHYRDLKCSSDDFVSELSRDSRHVLTRDQRKKLRVVYSTISPSVVSVSSFLVFSRNQQATISRYLMDQLLKKFMYAVMIQLLF